MPKLLLVTGSRHKLAEWRRILPAEYQLENVEVELAEIQSLDPKEIILDKAKRAYEIVKQPLVVEDVTAGLDALHGLPGPFVKFFEQRLGKGALYQIAPADKAATVSCTICYYDGVQAVFGTGTVHGQVVPARGNAGFGFDFVFVPEGCSKTFAEMSRAEKDAISHRSLAIHDLLSQLKQL